MPTRLGRDLRDAWRSLLSRPGFTATAVFSLAIGIGANTAIFTLVNAIILRDLPVDEPAQLVDVYLDQADITYSTLSYPDFEDFRDGTTDVFSGVAGMQIVPVQIDIPGGVTIVMAEAVTGNFFPLLGVEAVVGRTLLPQDDVAPGAHPVVMLSYGYWQRAYGGDRSVVGAEIRIGGRAYTIVGVAPRDYGGTMRGLEPALYASIMMINELQPTSDDLLTSRGNHSMFGKARLRSGVGLPEAEVAAQAVATELAAARIEDWDPTAAFVLVPTTDVLLYPPMDRYVRATAWLLMTVVALVLLLACTNLASFLLARALERRRDVAVRVALGASRGVLVRGLLTETTLLSLVAGLVGIGIAVGLLRLLVTADLPLPVPVTLDLSIDLTVLVFTLAVSLVAGALLGVVPAWYGTRGDVLAVLKSDSAGGGRPGHLRWRSGLVVTQLTISVVLLVGAGLFLRSMGQIQQVDPGFGHEPSAVMTFGLPATRFTEAEGRVFARRLLDRFEELPGVVSVGLINTLHLDPLSTNQIEVNVEGVEPPADRGGFILDRSDVDPGFFDAVGIRLVRGRNFTTADRVDTQPVAIVSEAMAARFWPGHDAVGQRIRAELQGDLLVVGVASDANIRALGETPRSVVYLPYSQHYSAAMTVVARTLGDPERTAAEMLQVGRQLDPELWVWQTKTMAEHLGLMRLPAQLSAFVLTAFAMLALALAIVGLYGVVHYGVALRTREVGVRMALGADRGSVVRLLAASGLRLVMVGSVLGLVLSLALGRLLRGLLFDVGVADPVTFLSVPAILAGTALLATYLPARRASQIDPAVALRTE